MNSFMKLNNTFHVSPSIRIKFIAEIQTSEFTYCPIAKH